MFEESEQIYEWQSLDTLRIALISFMLTPDLKVLVDRWLDRDSCRLCFPNSIFSFLFVHSQMGSLITSGFSVNLFPCSVLWICPKAKKSHAQEHAHAKLRAGTQMPLRHPVNQSF